MSEDKIQEAICDLIKDVTTNLSHLNRLDDKSFPDDKKCYKNTPENRMKMKGDCFECPSNLQTIHTPPTICSEIVEKLREYTELDNKEICVFNLEFLSVLKYNYNIPMNNIWFVTDCQNKAKIAKYLGVNVIEESMELFLMKNGPRKFDVICMNPPYQAPKEKEHEGRGKCGKSLWEDFVKKSLKLVKENGYVCNIHPPRWRKPDSKIGEEIKQLQLLYVKMYGLEAGKETFKCQTDFDWYILQNKKCTEETEIVDQNHETINCQTSNLPFIPDTKIKDVMSLVAKNGEEKVNLLYNCSYHHQTRTKDGTMSRIKDDKFKYPVIYSIKRNDEIVLFYSSVNDRGHFGIPKVIWGQGHSGIFIDYNGQYALTEFTSAIVDSPDNLLNIANALKSEKFVKDIMGYKSQGGNAYEKKIISLLRKDFWKEFVDENGNEKV
jgi:hypothetical protein